jgi:hypothetical protein
MGVVVSVGGRRGTSKEGEEIVAMGAMDAVTGDVRKTEEEAMAGRGMDGKEDALFVLIKAPEGRGKAVQGFALCIWM